MTPVTPQDINKYITMIRINFENAYKSQNDTERQMLIRSWYEILKEYPKEVCDRAVIAAIKNAEYAPRIGSIVKEIEKMREAYEKTDSELWAELISVLREVEACRYRFRFNFVDPNGLTQGENARHRVERIFEGLSPELKEYCKTSHGLINIAQYTDEQLSYERGRFIRVMPYIKERARTRAATPENLAGLLKGLSVHLQIDSNRTKLLKGE